MKIPEKVEKTLEETDLVYVGTCSDETPNVSIVGYFKIIDEDKILLADNYFKKTRKNIEKNPSVAITAKFPEESTAYELKGAAEIYTEGEIFEEMKEWVLSKEKDMPAKAAVVVTIEKVFDSTPGESAGEEISVKH